jgi:hypothetical protein
MEHALRVSALLGAQVVLLGSAPDPVVQRHFEALAAEFAQVRSVGPRLCILEHAAPSG